MKEELKKRIEELENNLKGYYYYEGDRIRDARKLILLKDLYDALYD